MIKAVLHVAVVACFILCLSVNLFAQTAGTLTFKFTETSQSPTYTGTKNVVAVWIESGTAAATAANFVKARVRYVGGGTNDHLPTFAVAAGGSAGNAQTPTMPADAVSGATLNSFTTITTTWNGTNTAGTLVADGTYSVVIQETWNHGTTGTATAYFSFTKGPTAVTLTPANTAQFSSISLVWTPTITNTLATGTISGSPFCGGQTGISIPYTATGTFTSGNTFTAQLSSSTGSFTSPTTIGTLASTATSGTITSSVALPNTAGTAYRIRVISNTPATTGTDNGVNLTISAAPTTANAGPDQSICITSTATLAGNTATTGTGTWSLVSGTGNITSTSSATTTITGLGVGANTFRWTISNGTCTPSTDDVIITGVAAPTTANAGPDQSICTSSAATMAGNTPSTGTGVWSLVSGAGSITTPSSPATAITGLGVGANTFKWTISNGVCTASTDNIIITGVAAPSIANAGPDQTACTTSATLAANTPVVGTGMWTLISGTGTIASPSSPTSTVTGLTAGANTFRWTISNGPCTSSTDDIIITQAGTITTANAGPDQSVCGTSATLAGNVPTTGTGAWSLVSGTGTIASSTSATSTITGLGAGANTFRWTISNGACTPSTDDVVITGFAAPTTANAGPDQTACATSATLAGNAPVTGTGTWTLVSGTGTITSPSSPTSTVTGLTAGANTFRWTISNGPCTSSTDDIVVTQAGTITTANAGPDQSVCGTSATLAGNVPTTGTGAWSLVSGTGTIASSTSATSTVTGLGAGANTFRWTISNGACTPSTDDVVITGFAIPTTANAGPDQNLCATTATLAGNVPSTGTGMWSLVSGSGNITSSTSATSTITGLGVGPNTFRWTISNGTCTPSKDDVIITGVANPTTANAGPAQSGCITSATMAGNAPSTGTGQWTLVSGTGTITNASSPATTVTGIGAGANTFRWTISNGICTPSTSDVIITQNCPVSITMGSVSGSPFCSGTSYAVSVPFTTTGSFTGTFIAELSDAAGSFNSPVTIGSGSNSPIAAMILSSTTTGNGYRIRVRNTAPATVSPDNGSDLSINTCLAIVTGSVSGSPFCSNSSFDLVVPFTTSGGTFTGSFIAELSNATGSFIFPTTIGYGSMSPINATIPLGMATGNKYRVRVSNASMSIYGSDNGTDLLINTCGGVSTGIMGYSTMEGVHVYPNPNQGNFLMSTDGLDGKIAIEVTNALGELVLRKDGVSSSGGSIPIEIPSAKAGLYFIKIQTETKMGIKKFAVN
jgi:hypothetical protein